MTVIKSRFNEEVPGHQKWLRFRIRLKRHLPPTKLWSAQIRFNNVRFKKELTSRKFEFKGRQKISGWKWRFRFKIRFKGKMSSTKLWISQYPVQNPDSRRIYLLQKVKNCQRGPAAMMRGSNMGILPYWPNILLITWGLLLHKAGSLFFFTSCVVTRRFCLKAASGLPLGLAFQSTMLCHLGAWSCPNQCNTSW